jgi:hypothetical protein
MIPASRQRELANVLKAPIIELEGGHRTYESNPLSFARAVADGILRVALS